MEPVIQTNISDSTVLYPYKKQWLWFLILLIAVASLFSFELWIPLAIVFLIPFMILILFDIRSSIYFLLISVFVGVFILKEPYGLRPVDLLIIFTIFAYIFHKIFTLDFSLPINELSKPAFIFLAAIFFSLIDAPNFQKGLINFFKHLELFLLFFILADLFSSWSLDRLRRLIEYFIYIAAAATLIALVFMFLGENTRAFGITGTPLPDLTVSALIASITFLIMSKNRRRTQKFLALASLLFLGLVMTQTRGAWLSFSISFLFLSYLLLKKSIPGTKKKLFQIFFLGLVLILLLFLVFQSAFIGISHRVSQVQYVDVGTIQFRFILWHAAITAFLANPLNGIGLGHFSLLSGQFSDLGTSELFKENIEGLSAHNVLISYLSETGLIGISALIFFYYSITKLAQKTYNRSKSEVNLDVVIVLRAILFFVIVSSAYAGSWFWGLNATQFRIFLSISTVVAKKL